MAGTMQAVDAAGFRAKPKRISIANQTGILKNESELLLFF
jgi:hypothetical protein